jgi:DnaJ-class molecular chaperone
MEITVKLVSQINSATKPLACDCFDPGGKTRPHCSVCDGKGGMKGCPACGGAGMSPDGSRQVRLCPDCRGRGYLQL